MQGRVVLPTEYVCDLEALGEFALSGGHAAECDVVFAVCKGAVWIDDGDFADGGELFEQRREGEVDACQDGGFASERCEKQCEHAVECVDPYLLVGPVAGGLPVKEVGVFHVLEPRIGS